MDFAIKERVALVTGAARGIGKGIAARLALEGARVVMADIAPLETIQAAAREIGGTTPALAVRCDVSSYADVEETVARLLNELGSIDILVNNAGIVSRKPIIEVPRDEWQRVLDTNLGGCFNCCQIVGRAMAQAGLGGRIVNISSIHGRIARANMASYCASKAAIDMVTEQLAVELAPHDIAVNAVACGAIETDMNYPLYRSVEPLHVALQKATRLRIPAGKFGHVDDIGNAVAFLASPVAARYVTGTILYVDGGYVADGTVRFEEPV